MRPGPVLLVLSICSAIIVIQGQSSGNRVAILLKQLEGLQVVIRLPKEYYASSVATETLLHHSLFDLQGTCETPLQLFFNRKRSATFHPARHTKNVVAWLVFASNFPETNQLRLGIIVDSCLCWPDKYHAFSLHRDLMHLILIDYWHNESVPLIRHIRRCSTPFFLVVLSCSLPDNLGKEGTWAFDVCFTSHSCRAVALPSFKDLANHDLHFIVESVTRARNDFMGELVRVHPFFTFGHLGMTFWQALLSSPVRNVAYMDLQKFYMAYIISTFGRRHNFTFDIIPPVHNTSSWAAACDGGTIEMRSLTFCREEFCSFGISFAEFTDFRTLMAAELFTPTYYKLSSLAMPLGPAVVCTSLITTLLMGFAFSLRVPPSKVSKLASDWFRHSYWRLLPSVSISSKRNRWLSALWVIAACFVSIIYLSMLQSAVVAPSLYESDVSFDSMVRQNFCFVSFNANLMKTVSSVASLTDHGFESEKLCLHGSKECLQSEVVLGKRIKQTGLLVPSAPPFLLSLSREEKRVLVEDHRNRRLYASVIKALGRNALEGKERFFPSSYYWEFNVEKPFILQTTLERMHAAGLVYSSLDKAEAMHSMYLRK